MWSLTHLLLTGSTRRLCCMTHYTTALARPQWVVWDSQIFCATYQSTPNAKHSTTLHPVTKQLPQDTSKGTAYRWNWQQDMWALRHDVFSNYSRTKGGWVAWQTRLGSRWCKCRFNELILERERNCLQSMKAAATESDVAQENAAASEWPSIIRSLQLLRQWAKRKKLPRAKPWMNYTSARGSPILIM